MSKSTRGKMSLSSLNAAELNLCRKNGCGLTYLCRKYDCADGQIEKRVYTLYKKTPKKAKEILRDLREIDRKTEKVARRRAEADESTLVVLAKINVDEVADDAQIPEEASVPNKTPDYYSLEELKARDAALDGELLKVEQQHRKVEETRHGIKTAMGKILEKSEELKREVDELEKEFGSLHTSFTSAGEELKRLTAEKNDLVKKQEEIRIQIAQLEKVEIYVYDDETITISGGLAADDSGYEALLAQLLRRQDCRRMAIWELELLARTITVVRHLGLEGEKLEVVFENSNIETAFAKISSEEAANNAKQSEHIA